jgi:hypothetical protein
VAMNSVMMTAALVIPGPFALSASAQLPAQSFSVTLDTALASVGDSVAVRFRIRLHERDQLLDSTPQVVGDLAAGVRVLSVEKLRRSADRVYEGGARVAFYRLGRRAVPVFGVPFMRVVEGVSRGTLTSDSTFADIKAVLPAAGNPPLKDIRELDRRPLSLWPWLALASALLAGAGLYLRYRRRGEAPTIVHADSRAEPPAPSPYDIAVERLNRVESEQWPARDKVALHYEAVAQALRQYLEDAHGVGALERTTSELLWAIPPHLARRGLRDQCREVLMEADLVKFAHLQPGTALARDFLERARHLLDQWHAASPLEEGVHALR